ncbi:TPA: hypothetical protein R8G44_004334, partial [Citrobacter braakii]|nr:hypothetical protein [Citrobacter braakii]
TADGAGSTGTDVTGDGNDINNTGDNGATNGGTGTSVDGDGNTVDNGGKNTADGAGSTGTDVTGDGNDINNTGDNSATGGGTGTDVDGNDNTINNGGKNTADGAGSTGTDVTGNSNDINNTGDNSGTNGGTGTSVDGNENTINNGGKNTADGAGSTGTDVTGDGNDINNTGDNSATGGGTGTKADGNGNIIDNKGKTTADGAGSIGTDVTGDKNEITNEGDTSATAGGTGTSVDGSGNIIDNKGKTTADGAGSTGTDVTGDKNEITNEGDTSATAGGTGTSVDGNNNTVDNKGKTTADGTDSAGTDVAGNNNIINNVGESSVTGGATGTKVSGDSNTINQNGKMVVGELSTGLNVTGNANIVNLASDDMTITGKQATGAIVAGDDNEVTLSGVMNVSTSATGLNVSGTSADVKLSGTVNVTANTEDSLSKPLRFADGLGYRGVVVSSQNDSAQNATNVLVDGSINVKDNRTDPMAYPNSPTDPVPFGRDMTGLDVSGAFNNVTVTGSISLDATPYHTELINNGTIKGATNTYQDHVKGLNVTGNNNAVVVQDGINLNSAIETSDWAIAPDMVGIAVNGAGNQVTVQGASSLTGRSASDGYMEFASITGGGLLILDDTSTLNIATKNNGSNANIFGTQSILVEDANSKFINKGDVKVTATGGSFNSLAFAKKGSMIENSGSITMDATPITVSNGYIVDTLAGIGSGTKIINSGDINVIHNKSANQTRYDFTSDYTPIANKISVLGISVTQPGVTGSNSGTITTTGGNTWAMGANMGATITNETGGVIVHNANSATQNLTLQCNANLDCISAIGGGMVIKSGTATNNGAITVNDSGVGMYANGGTIINKGTINLENTTGTTPAANTQLIGMAVFNGGVAYNDGTININADNGQAFYNDGAAGSTIHNSGTINLNGGAMSSDDTQMGSAPTDSNSAPASVQRVSGYVLGTSASGSVGTLNAGSNALALDSVSVDTGFTAGTAATTQTFDNVFTGADVEGVENITSESVVWSAQGQKDASGNVDVTMTKNAYTDVVTDSSVSGVAGALDAAYTNNELFSSLNLKTSADVTKAMKQISGNKAVNVSRDARRLSNRFDMLADAAPELGNGLSFNLVAKGDQRAELGKDTQYDMMALRQKLGFGDNQSLTMEYGIARLDGKGNVSSGSDGITGGYSQFLGLEHAMPLGEEGLSWNNALRYDVHQLDSKRGINYGDVNKQALADSRQQYLELRTEGRKTFAVSEGLDVVPYAGLKLRHTMEDGYQERGAGDFNLNMNSSTETAVDSVVGMKLSYAGKDGWAATATLEGGPNLSYVSTGKKASLQGAAGQSFNVDDGQKGGSINSMAQVGVKYNAGNTSAGLDAFHWKEDNISDKGFMLNIKHNF